MGTRTTTGVTIKLEATGQIRNTLPDGQIATASVGQAYLSDNLQSGVAADQCNRMWESRSRALSDDTYEDIDLYDLGAVDIGAGAGNDALGQALVIDEIVMILVKHRSGAGRLEINPVAPTNVAEWTPTLTVANGGALREGGVWMLYQPDTFGLDVVDNASNKIRFHAKGGDVAYDILVIGRNDDDESSDTTTQSSSKSSSSRSTSSSSLSSTSVSSVSSSSTQSASTSSASSKSSSTQSLTTTSQSTVSSSSVSSKSSSSLGVSSSSSASSPTSSSQSLTSSSASPG